MSAAIMSLPQRDLEPRIPPSNLAAEQQLLGAILHSNAALNLDEVVAVRPEHFTLPVHGRILDVSRKLADKGSAVNYVTLWNYFEHDEDMAALGGVKYLSRLLTGAVHVLNVRNYADQVRFLYLDRQHLAAIDDMRDDIDRQSPEEDALARLDRHRANLDAIAEQGEDGDDLTPLVDHWNTMLAQIDRRRTQGNDAIATGFPDLDYMLAGGLHPTDLAVIAARPGVGKTALGGQIALNAARRGKRVAFFSLEMSGVQIAQRMAGLAAGVGVSSLRDPQRLTDREIQALVNAGNDLAALPLWVDQTPAATVSRIRARSRRLKRRAKGLDLIVIDYLQLMRDPERRRDANRVYEIGEITAGLKALAKDFEVPVLLLAQLNRAVENRPDKRPGLADLRDSGSIEQDVDVAAFLYRAAYHLAQHDDDRSADDRAGRERLLAATDPTAAEIIVRKNRHGPAETVRVRWNGELTRFDSMTTQEVR
jgi:replicative DNA helicase